MFFHLMKIKYLLFLTLFCATTAAAQVKVAIFSLNDFHGAFVRNDSKGIAGAPAIVQTLDSLKRVYPLNVTVSAGDNFGGSYFYNATHGQLLPVFFHDLGITLSALGNHEFDDGQRSLSAKWSLSPLRPQGWNITYVCANVRETKTGRVPAFAQPVASIPVPLPGGKKLHVAFTGLITSATPYQVSTRRIAGLTFYGNYPAVLDSVMQLPEASLVKGADISILLTHIGSRMDAAGNPVWDDIDSLHLCALPPHTWQGILSSHSHKAVCGHINEARLPIVQGRWHGDYISALLCTVDTATHQVTAIEPRLFRVTPKESLEVKPARLQAQIDSLLANTRTAGGTPIGEKITTMPCALEHDRDHKYCQTEVGRLVCAAYASAFRKAAGLNDGIPVIGCSHFGSIRAGFAKGEVTVLDVGEVLPFSNALRTYRLTGKQLTDLVEFGLHNQRYGWLQTAGLEVETDHGGHVAGLVYVSPQGKRKKLKPDTECYLVADEFITHGGDGYDPTFFPDSQEVKTEGMPATTDAFIDYLRNK